MSGEVRGRPDSTRYDLSTGVGGFDSESTGENEMARTESMVSTG